MFKLPKSLIIFDVETSGINPETSSIVQLGAVIFNKNGHLEEDFKSSYYTFNEYVKPYTDEWEEEACNIHKIKRAFLENNGKDINRVLKLFEFWISPFNEDLKKKYWLAQWSCGFDTSMLTAAYKKIEREYPFHYRSFDVASIVRWHLAKQGKLFQKCGEDVCARALGIKVYDTQLHDALYDSTLSGLMLEKIIKGEIK